MSPDRVSELEGALRAVLDSIRYWKTGVLSTPPSVLLDVEQLIVRTLEGSEREATPESKPTP